MLITRPLTAKECQDKIQNWNWSSTVWNCIFYNELAFASDLVRVEFVDIVDVKTTLEALSTLICGLNATELKRLALVRVKSVQVD